VDAQLRSTPENRCNERSPPVRRLSCAISQYLESLVKAKLNPFGHGDIQDEVAYVRRLRKKDRKKSDEEFIEEIRRWEKINS
jgi:hypothetical protein